MASSPSSSLWKFDVFLSFRGEDTRKGFVSHLYKEFVRKGVRTFRDDEELQKGKSISPELLQAIGESKFAVVVISQNYASSSWCLDELVEIIKCEKKGSLKIFPVFYEVDPSDVKKQNGPFAESFRRHEDNPKVNLEKVQQWKKALTKVATIAGEDSRNWNEDSGLIERIVDEISNKLVSTMPSDFSDLVGMDHHMDALSVLLNLDSTNEVRMIGIWGMPGVGKTTLARYVYETICQHFQAHCFVEDVKKFYREHGPKHLQERLLSTNLGGALSLRSSLIGRNVIKARLGHQKVLVVIDDVDEMEQLNVLAKDTSWFGLGSRIIVTTQNKHLLVAHGVELVYEVNCLFDDIALQLFCQYAFKQKQPLLGFEQLSSQAMNYAGGLPLALKVLGSSLRGRSEKEWDCILSRCDRSLDKGITDILKMGYGGLNKQEKFIFLHIACLFDGVRVKDVTRILNDDHEDAKFVIQSLAEKSLIDIQSGNINMHGLLQQIGRELVLDGDSNCRLLIDHEEICNALTNNKVNKEIEGICLDMFQIKERRLSISDGAFERIHSLKFLKFYNNRLNNEVKVHLPSSVNLTKCKLRYLQWDDYPLRNLQVRFDCLVVLNMRGSKLEKLWEGSLPTLMSLKRIDLSYSVNLREIPDLSKALNLEHLDISFCRSLTEVPSSVKGLNKLVKFILEGCSGLVWLPSNANLKSLELLVLRFCKRLKGFPQISLNIRRIHLSLNSEIELPDWIGNLSYLVELGIYDCKRLKRLPTTVGNLRFLERMVLEGCEMLGDFPNTIEELVSLRDFSLCEGRNIRKMPRLPPNIEELAFSGTSIEEVPQWISNLSKLRRMDLKDNTRLKNLPASISMLECLGFLDLCGCSSLEIFPAKICQTMAPLNVLNLLGTGIKELPDNFGKMTALTILGVPCITRGKGLSSIVKLRSLRVLCICKDAFKPIICHPHSDFPVLNTVGIPDDLGHYLPHLGHLNLSGNNFQAVPVSTKDLTSLRELRLDHCRNLLSLPQLSCSVKSISAQGCVSLISASPAFDCSLDELYLSGCIQLGPEAQSLAQYLASRDGSAGKKLIHARLPVSEVPRNLKHQAKGSSLTIHLPESISFCDFSDVIVCVVVATEGHYGFISLVIECTSDYRDSCGHSVYRYTELLYSSLFVSERMDAEAENMILSKAFYSRGRVPEYFQDIHFSFNVRPFVLMDNTSHPRPRIKVKACGVGLVFQEDIDLDDECGDIVSTDKISDEEPESSNKRQECSNEISHFESEDIERQDSHQLGDARSQKFSKFLCCIGDAISQLFSH